MKNKFLKKIQIFKRLKDKCRANNYMLSQYGNAL